MSLFSPAQLATIIAETIPADTSPAITHVVVATVDEEGAQVVVSLKRQDGPASWTVQAVAKHTWSGENQAGGSVILKW